MSRTSRSAILAFCPEARTPENESDEALQVFPRLSPALKVFGEVNDVFDGIIGGFVFLALPKLS